MTKRISRRRYQELTAFFKEVLASPTATLRMKMSAAQRLDDLYARVESREVEAERREHRERERKELALEAQREKTIGSAAAKITPSEPEAEDVEDRRVRGIWSEILNKPRREYD